MMVEFASVEEASVEVYWFSVGLLFIHKSSSSISLFISVGKSSKKYKVLFDFAFDLNSLIISS